MEKCLHFQDFLNRYSSILKNISWIALVEIVVLLTPLITYPYLVRVLGKELYGYVITAQVLSSYATIIVDFGSNAVCAKHVSINRSNPLMLSEIVCSVLTIRTILWFVCFAIYMGVVIIIPAYRSVLLLFLYTYFMVLNDVLFPRYFFQGIEDMKMVSLISVFTKLFFVGMIFILIRDKSDYLWIPILYSLGFALGGVFALWKIFVSMRIKFAFPRWERMRNYINDSMPILTTDLICTIKDKFNYQLLGFYVGMGEVVIYDLGFKLNSLLAKPTSIITTVLFPRFAKNKNFKKLKISILINFSFTLLLCILLNIFLAEIVAFFLNESIELWPIRLLSLAPVFLSVSIMIYQNFFVAFGFTKYVLYSILVTTTAYLSLLLVMMFTNSLNSLYSFVFLAIASYLVEMIYRICIVINKRSYII